jgi:serine/threonine protein kinase
LKLRKILDLSQNLFVIEITKNSMTLCFVQHSVLQKDTILGKVIICEVWESRETRTPKVVRHADDLGSGFNKSSHDNVCVKICRPDPHRLESPQDEEQIYGYLATRGLHVGPELLHCFRQDANIVFVFKLAKQDLFDFLANHRKLRISFAQDLVRQICKLVITLHTHGIAHMDLSLENILIMPNHELRLCDFALARFFDVDARYHINLPDRTHPYDRRFIGKEMYTSPRLIENREYNAFTNDNFALGSIALVLLVGAPAWKEYGDKYWQSLKRKGLHDHLRSLKLLSREKDVKSEILAGLNLVEYLWYDAKGPLQENIFDQDFFKHKLK